MSKNLAVLVPYSKSDKKNKKIASRKTGKYAMPAMAKTIDTQKGKKRTENSNTTEAKILKNTLLIELEALWAERFVEDINIITSYYFEVSFDARPV